jgi:CheY-like chemotaxis protein
MGGNAGAPGFREGNDMKKIVIVDNDRLSVEALANVLSGEGYLIHKAYNGVEGLEAIRTYKPDVVLLDLFMPGIDGRRLCRYLKKAPEFENLKVVILSPITLNATIRFMEVYADAYVAKGYIMDVAEHVSRLLKLLQKRGRAVSPEELALGFEGRTPRVVVEELLEERQHFDAILHNVGDGILEANADDVVTYINPAGQRIINKSELQIIGHNLVDVLGKRYDGQFQEILFRLKRATVPSNQQIAVTYGKRTLDLNFANLVSEGKRYLGALLILQDVTYLTERIRELTLLNDVGQLLTSSLDFNDVLRNLMSQIRKIMRVEAVSLLLIEKETKDLIFQVVLGGASQKIEHSKLSAGQGIVGWVAKTGQPVLIPDVSKDSRFDKTIDRNTGFVTKSMICVPLKIRDEVIGVIQVLNHENGRPFNDDNLYLLSSISMYASIAIEHANLYQELHRIEKEF